MHSKLAASCRLTKTVGWRKLVDNHNQSYRDIPSGWERSERGVEGMEQAGKKSPTFDDRGKGRISQGSSLMRVSNTIYIAAHNKIQKKGYVGSMKAIIS